ncbi:MAG: NAD(P)/FAD-dependent oxidoreductase [Roseibium sp.]
MSGAQPKSQQGAQNALSNELFDVLVIGAGVVGCAMARRFTLEGAKVAIVEKASDILDGASKANSAILHTGFDAPVGSLELECIREGYREYEEIRDDLGLVQEKSGALVVAWTANELEKLEGIVTRAHQNGVTDVRFKDQDSLRQAEPNLSERALGAVKVPRESIIDPWSAPYVYLSQALENGAQVFLSCAVTGGTFDGQEWQLETGNGSLRARTIVNCAGLYGDLVDEAVLGKAEFKIVPRKGQFVVFDKAANGLVNSVILPVPTEETKGIVLFRTVFGNLVVGPTAEDQQSRTDVTTDSQTLKDLIGDAVAKIPGLAEMPVTAVYAGLRPASERKEYRVETLPERNWITVGGIRSTGLSASLGIARHVYSLYESFGHKHQQLTAPETPQANMLAQSGKRDWHRTGYGEIVCHCEMVTSREIEAALSGVLGARSIGGLKRQTRATMGRCQGFYCSARLAELTDGKFDLPMSEEFGHD